MSKLISLLILLIGSILLSVATIVHGYGVDVKSWPWIVGGFIGQCIIMRLTQLVSQE